jgi:hypothetical protein
MAQGQVMPGNDTWGDVDGPIDCLGSPSNSLDTNWVCNMTGEVGVHDTGCSRRHPGFPDHLLEKLRRDRFGGFSLSNHFLNRARFSSHTLPAFRIISVP